MGGKWDSEDKLLVFLKEAILHCISLLTKIRYYTWLNEMLPNLVWKLEEHVLFKGCNGSLFFLWSFNPGAGLPTDKKKAGPSPGDVEAIKVNMSGQHTWAEVEEKNCRGSELNKRFLSPGNSGLFRWIEQCVLTCFRCFLCNFSSVTTDLFFEILNETLVWAPRVEQLV